MEIIKIEPCREPQLVEGIITAYQQSFGGDPWNEGYLCPHCGRNYPLSYDEKICPECKRLTYTIPLVEYWSRSRVMADFFKEMAKPGAICITAIQSGCVFGFAWGYTIKSEPEIDKHLDAPNVYKLFENEVFYLDECAVIPCGQGMGLGQKLVTSIFGAQKYSRVILRTKEDSRMHRLIHKHGGDVILRIANNRVIMSCSVLK